MKARDLLVILIGFVFVMPFFFTSCEENGEDVDTIVRSDTVYMTEKTTFILKFGYLHYNLGGIGYESDIVVSFLTDNLSQLPELTVNDTTVKHFVFDEEFLTATLKIPYNEAYDTLEYSVSIGDSSTTGSIALPEIEEISCNDSTLLVNDPTVDVHEADSFGLEWTTDADYAIISHTEQFPLISLDDYPLQQWEEGIIETNHYAIDTGKTKRYVSDGDPYLYELEFDFGVVNGVKMVPGATPNVKGDYGNGFVKASVSEGMPDVEMNVDGDYEPKSGQKARVKEKFLEEKPEELIKELKEDYKRLIKIR